MFIPSAGEFEPWQPEDAEKRHKADVADKELRRRMAVGPKKPWHDVAGLLEPKPLSVTNRLILFIGQPALSLALIAAGAGIFWLENIGDIRGRGTTDLLGLFFIVAGAVLFCVPFPGSWRRSG